MRAIALPQPMASAVLSAHETIIRVNAPALGSNLDGEDFAIYACEDGFNPYVYDSMWGGLIQILLPYPQPECLHAATSTRRVLGYVRAYLHYYHLSHEYQYRLHARPFARPFLFDANATGGSVFHVPFDTHAFAPYLEPESAIKA